MNAIAPSRTRLWTAIDSRFDRLAIGLSGLCLVHCVASAVLFGIVAWAGALFNPMIHEIGLMLAICLGVAALGRGIFTHGQMMPAAIGGFGLGMMGGALNIPHGAGETLFTLIGVGCVALGHGLNRRAVG